MIATAEEQVRQQFAMVEWALGEHRAGSTAEDFMEIAARRFKMAVEISKEARASLVNSRALAKGKVAGA